jgi:hypothetical protein
MVTREIATVFYGGGRRWFTLDAACRAEAFRSLKRRAHTRGWYEYRHEPASNTGHDELVIPEVWLGRGMRLLTRWHKAAFKVAATPKVG